MHGSLVCEGCEPCEGCFPSLLPVKRHYSTILHVVMGWFFSRGGVTGMVRIARIARISWMQFLNIDDSPKRLVRTVFAHRLKKHFVDWHLLHGSKLVSDSGHIRQFSVPRHR